MRARKKKKERKSGSVSVCAEGRKDEPAKANPRESANGEKAIEQFANL